MTQPANVDKSSVIDVLRTHVRPHLLTRIGGSSKTRHVTVNAATMAPIAQGVAVLGVADQIKDRIDPAVAEIAGEYLVVFGNYRVYLTGLISQTMAIVKCCDEVREYEFIRKTVHGSDAASAASRLDSQLKKLHSALDELQKLQVGLPLVQDQKGLAPFKAFNEKMRKLIGEAKAQADVVGEQFSDAVDFEVVKAIVRKDPHFKVETTFYVVRSAIAGMSLAGDICGLVPNPYTTPISIALRNVARGLSVAEALVHRQAISASNSKRVEEYLNTHAAADKWDEHDRDPSLMAEMLADKYKANVEIALVCADSLIGPVLDAFEYADLVWSAARSAIKSAFVGYANARLAKLAEELGRAPKGDLAKRAAMAFGEALLNEFKQDVFQILNPLNAIKGAVMSSVGDAIATEIMKHLPIDPAQAVDGATLKAKMDDLSEKLISGAPKRDEAYAAKMAAEEKAVERPTKDKDGRPVEKVLSGVLVDDAKEAYRLVQIGGVSGALYLASLDFAPVQSGDDVVEPLAVLPDKDSLGRTIDEVDLAVGFTTDHPVPAGMNATRHLWVRIGVIWGYLDVETEKFWPATVDRTGFADWQKRKIVKDGYYEDGDLVKGKWYRPFSEHHAGYYLFLAKDGSQEWARSQDNTGSGRGSNNTVAALTKPSGRFELGRL